VGGLYNSGGIQQSRIALFAGILPPEHPEIRDDSMDFTDHLSDIRGGWEGEGILTTIRCSCLATWRLLFKQKDAGQTFNSLLDAGDPSKILGMGYQQRDGPRI